MEFNPAEMQQPDYKKKFKEYRFIQDDFADAVAEEIVQSPHYAEVFRAWAKIEYNNQKVDFQIPKYRAAGSGDGPCQLCGSDEKHQLLNDKLNGYFRDTFMADYMGQHIEEVKKGCEFFNIYNATGTLALVTRSLLKQYAAFNATNVLMFTQMIKDAPNRRILESMRFVRDVMDPDGYNPNGRAIRNIQKLRLVHAVIRARINSGKYDRTKYISEKTLYLTKFADSVNDPTAKSKDSKEPQDNKLIEIVNYLKDVAKHLNDTVDKIKAFNEQRKNKNNPPRTIDQRAADLKQSISFLNDLEIYLAGAAQWLKENSKGYNEINVLLDNGRTTTFPEVVNKLERNSKYLKWHEADWGKPINQQDMIFAIHTFSVEVIDGLAASGEKMFKDEVESYYLAWHHIGHCLGVKDAINPKTYKDGHNMQQLIYQTEFNTAYNPNGPALAKPLLQFLKIVLPFNRPRQINAVIANYNIYMPEELNVKVNVNDLKANKVVFDPGQVIDEKENEKVKEIFKSCLDIDLEDIDKRNLFRLRFATFSLKLVVIIRKFIKSRNSPDYHYSSFILRHLGIVDMLDSQLTLQSHNPHGASFSGTDAEGEVIDESKLKQRSLASIVLSSVYHKVIKDIKGKFSSSDNNASKQAAVVTKN
ncbi:MAG: oxygenase MpaB family protein [Bacteroidia bacterium]